MSYGLPTRGQANWDDELNNSLEYVRGQADAAKAGADSAQSNANYARQKADEAVATARDAHEQATAPADEFIAGRINDATSETAAALSASLVRVSEAPLSPIKYGAKIDGSTDDTAAMQAALNAVPASGGAIAWQGRMVCNSALSAPNPTRLLGGGCGDHYGGSGYTGLASIDPTQAPTALITPLSDADFLTFAKGGSGIADLAVVCTPATPSAGAGIKFTTGDAALLKDARIQGFYDLATFAQYDNATVRNVKFIDAVHNGLSLSNTVNVDQGDDVIEGCMFSFSGKYARAANHALFWDSGGGPRITGNKVNMGPSGNGRWTNGFVFQPLASVDTSVFIIGGNSLENVTGAALAFNGGSGHISKVSITGNEISTGGSYGIILQAPATGLYSRFVVCGNVVDANWGLICENIDRYTDSGNDWLASVAPSYTGSTNVKVDGQVIQ